MKQRLLRRPSLGTILGATALMVALGGTAIGLPGKGVIDKNDLRKNVVKAKNIGKGAVATRHIRNGGIRAVDVIGCPSGTRFIDGRCWDQAARGPVGDIFAAADDCSSRAGRLPSILELRTIRDEPGIDLGELVPEAHYADDWTAGGEINVVGDIGGINQVSTTDDHPYRCVYERVR
jgi:hypothetical protein